MIRVLLADDQPLMASGIAMILSTDSDIEVVGEAFDGRQAISLARQLKPDVICLDVQMPILNGLDAAREIITDPTISAAVLMLTTFEREDYLEKALQHGASGYLLKNAKPESLIQAVKSAAAGDALIAPELTRAVIGRALESIVGSNNSSLENQNKSASLGLLTERENQVLCLVAEGLSNDEIAENLYVSRATVKTHVSNILFKLELRDRVQAVVWAHRQGIVS